MIQYHCYNFNMNCHIKLKSYGVLGYQKEIDKFYFKRNFSLKLNYITDLSTLSEEEEFQQLTVYEPVLGFDYDKLKQIQCAMKKLINVYTADFKIIIE